MFDSSLIGQCKSLLYRSEELRAVLKCEWRNHVPFRATDLELAQMADDNPYPEHSYESALNYLISIGFVDRVGDYFFPEGWLKEQIHYAVNHWAWEVVHEQ